ncbi:hypothetical protein PYCC9005_002738 [Savitreella phatthalungensis]
MRSVFVHLCTLNINGQVPPHDFASILAQARDADVIAFAFQESIKLDLRHVARDLLSHGSRTAHCERLKSSLRRSLPDNYRELHSEALVGLYLVLYVTAGIYEEVTFVQSAVVARGYAGLGNKGGVAVRFDVAGTIFCIVNAHDAAADDQVDRRNADLHALARDLVFPILNDEDVLVTAKGSVNLARARMIHGRPPTGQEPTGIEDADHIIIAGDLNYRIDLPLAEVMHRIREKQWKALLDHDQLRTEHMAGRVLSGFCEAPISFRPTYKFDPPGLGRGRFYDTSPKSRVPAYTDRILWCSREGLTVLPVKCARV